MIADAKPRIPAAGSPHVARPAGAAARDLALGYVRSVSAAWRGDARAAVFPLRLNAYWRGELPPAPSRIPDAVSPHGGAGRGIDWYQAPEYVLGYVPGDHGGYRVPVSAIPSLARCSVPAAFWPDDVTAA